MEVKLIFENKTINVYEQADQLTNGKFFFVGWTKKEEIDGIEKYCINTKTRKQYTYKTYKWLNGKIETIRYTDLDK